MNQPMEATEQLKNWIEENRQRQGWSLREASVKAGLSPGYLSQIMRGQPPGLEACAGLAQVFNVTTEYVLFLAGYLSRDPSRGIRPELQTILDDLESLRESPLYEPTLRAVRTLIDAILYKADLPE